MKKYTYLILAFICFVGWIVLDNLYSQLKWIALGIGIVMVVCAFLPDRKDKEKEDEDEDDDEDEDEDTDEDTDEEVEDDEAELIGKSKEMSEEEIEMNLAMDGDSYPQKVMTVVNCGAAPMIIG